MIRRMSYIVICICVLLALPACSSQQQRQVSCEEVVAAYKAAGCAVFHKHPADLMNIVCYIEVEADAGKRISFEFFETEKEAEEYASERQYNAVIWLFSVIYGEPTWVHTTTYRNIEIEYTDKSLYEIFDKLIN